MNSTMSTTSTNAIGSDLLFDAASKGKHTMWEACEDVVFGATAGILGKFVEYPFDTVKVRLQSQPDTQPLLYKGPIDCFRQSYRADGIVGLYRGISAPLVGAALETSSLFVWEQLAQKAFFRAGLYSTEEPLPLHALFMTGAISGAFTSLVLTPVELVKCKIQVPQISVTNGMVSTGPGALQIIKQVFQHQGIRGFWHGQLGTLIRETGGCAAWFGSKETATMLFHKYNTRRSAARTQVAADPQPGPLPLWQQAIAGALAGMSYNFLFFPADTIKSRMQTTDVKHKGAQITFWKEGVRLWQHHGIQGLYRGCGITVARAAPSSAFIFIVYDGLKRQFHS